MEAVFLSVDNISLLDAESSGRDKSPTRQEYRVKRSITLDPTVGSCSNFNRSLRRLFSLASTRYCYSMPPMSCMARPPTTQEYGSTGP
jgi:hypothetical protein